MIHAFTPEVRRAYPTLDWEWRVRIDVEDRAIAWVSPWVPLVQGFGLSTLPKPLALSRATRNARAFAAMLAGPSIYQP